MSDGSPRVGLRGCVQEEQAGYRREAEEALRRCLEVVREVRRCCRGIMAGMCVSFRSSCAEVSRNFLGSLSEVSERCAVLPIVLWILQWNAFYIYV